MNTIDNHKHDGRILYAGDTTLQTAAAYLGGVLTHYGHDFDYVDSSTSITDTLTGAQHSLFILSDYPCDKLGDEDFHAIVESVDKGAGLLIIGGWDSYHGLAGQYDQTPLAEILPVTIADSDDRVNADTPCVAEKVCDHAIISGLPFDVPPTIGGYNRVTVKDNAQLILQARHLTVRALGVADYEFACGDCDPLLAVGRYGKGRVAAYAGDVAPHWVGGLVDWGSTRVAAQAPCAGDVEVGDLYAEFFNRLVTWTQGSLS